MVTLALIAAATLQGAGSVPAPAAAAAPAPDPIAAVIPRPAHVTPGEGRFTIVAGTTIWSDAASAPVARQLSAYLAPATGFPLPVRIGNSTTGIQRVRLVGQGLAIVEAKGPARLRVIMAGCTSSASSRSDSPPLFSS